MSDEVQELLQKANSIQQQQQQAPAPEPEVPKPQFCPICRHPQGQPVIKADETELREFMRCVLGEQLYSKTYTIGATASKSGMKWKLQVLTNEQAQQMDRLIDRLTEVPNQTNRSKMSAIQETKLLFYLRQIGGTEYLPPSGELQTAAEIAQLFKDQFGQKSEMVSTFGLRLVVAFEQLVNILANAVFDETFWRGAGLV